MRTSEQILHDKINLPRLMKRLEQAVQNGDWSKTSPPKRETWIKAQAMLQQIRYARLLLKNVEFDNIDPAPAQERCYQHFGTTLKHLEDYMRQVEQQSTPQVQRPKPLLPSIRPPTSSHKPLEPSSPPSVLDIDDLLPASPDVSPTIPSPAQTLSSVTNQVSGPSHSTPATTSASISSTSSIPLSAPAPPTSSNITATATPPASVLTSHALHDQLSAQLALMATQLRLNATHFVQSLDKDRTVIETMQTKLEHNVDSVQHERIRLRDLRGRSAGTTCWVLLSIIVVLIAFVMMVFIIRLT